MIPNLDPRRKVCDIKSWAVKKKGVSGLGAGPPLGGREGGGLSVGRAAVGGDTL